MGMVTSRIHRAAGRFNAESRAEKVLAQSKPEPAPTHPSTEKYLQEILSDSEVKDSISRKDLQLDGFLKDVYITSSDPPPIKNPKFRKPSERDRGLPQFRGIVEGTELGFTESEFVPEGKITLKNVMQLLADHQTDPKKNDAAAIVERFKIHPSSADNILKYYGALNVIMNPAEMAENKLLRSKKPEPTVIEIENRIPEK